MYAYTETFLSVPAEHSLLIIHGWFVIDPWLGLLNGETFVPYTFRMFESRFLSSLDAGPTWMNSFTISLENDKPIFLLYGTYVFCFRVQLNRVFENTATDAGCGTRKRNVLVSWCITSMCTRTVLHSCILLFAFQCFISICLSERNGCTHDNTKMMHYS